jgi:hypothetical protein
LKYEGEIMKTSIWLIAGLLVLLAGCAPGYYAPAPSAYYEPQPYGVPSQWYGNDPSMQQWYNEPYFSTHYP